MSVDTQFASIKNGNIKAYEALFRSLYPALCAYAFKILKDADWAEEMVQEVFFLLWKNKTQLTITGSLNAYLYKAVHNKCLHLIEHRQVKEKYTQHQQYQNNEAFNADEAMHTGELYTVYKNTLRTLPQRCRQIFQMNRKYGYKYHEIAEKLSISVKTVEADMGKALKAFRQSFAAYNSTD